MTESALHLPPDRGTYVQLSASGPFAVAAVTFRDPHGALSCTLVAKATYELAPGECTLIELPHAIQEEDAHWDGDPSRSVHLPSDLAPFKPAAEVVVVGSAYAGTQVPSLVTRVLVGSVDKSVEAFPPRYFRQDGSVSVSAPARRFSLRYEHAAGGAGTDNPPGIDATRPDAKGWPVPQLLPPHFTLRGRDDHFPTAGLGPIAPSWPLRASRLAPSDRAWLRDPTGTRLPTAFPARFFQAAPEDQWLDRALAANERIVLDGLHAEVGRLVTSLPGLEPRAVVAPDRPFARAPEVVRMVPDLLVIDTDRSICTLTFRAQIPLVEGGAPLRVVVVGVEIGNDLSPAEAARVLLSAPPDDVETTHVEADPTGSVPKPTPWGGRPVLPFAVEPRVPTPGARGDGLPFRARGEPQAPRPAGPVAATKPSVWGAAPAKPPARDAGSGGPELAPAGPPVAPPLVIPRAPPPSVAVPPASPPPPALVPLPVTSVLPPPVPSLAAPSEPFAVRASESPLLGRALASVASPASAPVASSGPPPAAAEAPKRVSGGSASFDAAFGAAKASDAAARASAPSDPPSPGRERKDAAAPPAAHAEGKRQAVVSLVCFEAAIVPRLRAAKRYAVALASRPKAKRAQGVDEPRRDEPVDDRADVLRVLSCARPVDAVEIRRALADCLDDLEDLEPPLVLVAGELRPTFDEIETLRATVAVVLQVAGGDKKVLASIAVAQEALAAPHAPRPETTLGLVAQIRKDAATLAVSPRYVPAEVERLLTEGRKYKRRSLLGALHVRADLALAASSGQAGEVLPLYLPDSASASLPLLSAFPVVALCLVTPREDLSESHDEALFAQALGRVLRSRG